jgi:hypothetical protein
MLESVKEAPTTKKSEEILEKNHGENKNKEKSFFFKDIEISAIKEALLTEIDMTKLKESLVDDIKETLLKEIDVSGIKEALTKDITLKSKNSEKTSSDDNADKTLVAEEQAIEKVNLPAYKYGLTESLTEDHKELLSIYGNIMESAKNNEFTMLPMMLSNFSKKCLTHVNEEEELYNFMKILAGSRSEIERKVAREFSAEMKNLSVSIFTTLNQSSFIPVTDNSVDGFIKEFEELGSVLQERIGREEKILYPMYENSRKVVDIC